MEQNLQFRVYDVMLSLYIMHQSVKAYDSQYTQFSKRAEPGV